MTTKLNLELVRLETYASMARLICLHAMDTRSPHATREANIYHKALHAYRVELRRQRMKETIIMQAGRYQASDYNEGVTDWGCGPYLTPKGESK